MGVGCITATQTQLLRIVLSQETMEAMVHMGELSITATQTQSLRIVLSQETMEIMVHMGELSTTPILLQLSPGPLSQIIV